MAYKNQAAWLPGKGLPTEVGPIETAEPGPGELLIKNRAIGLNPVDYLIKDSNVPFVKKWPTLAGEDLAGEVVKIGDGVTGYQAGDRVMAHAVGLATGKESDKSFQLYTIVFANAAAILPDSVSFEAASALPLSLSTAAAGLYAAEFLNLSLPSINPKPTGQTLLVWGGASSVGCATIQLAVASGVEVYTTASPRNHDLVKGLGAKQVFDYNSPSVVGDIVEALQGKKLVGVYDAISDNNSILPAATVLAQLGGGILAATLPPPESLPATVKSAQVFAPFVFVKEPSIGKAVYQYAREALANGELKPAPPVKVVGKGLEHIDGAMSLLKKGVSGTKVVVSL